jgi:hypothetical protein
MTVIKLNNSLHVVCVYTVSFASHKNLLKFLSRILPFPPSILVTVSGVLFFTLISFKQ